MKTNITPQNICKACGYKFDHRPAEGDFTLCLKCGAILRFNADLTTREATPGELEALDIDTYAEIQRARSAIYRLHASKASLR